MTEGNRTRHFYTDPLAAAWMAKHFGVHLTRTCCHRGDGTFGESERPIPLWIFGRDIENQVSDAVRYYVHPDSLRILEPRTGDIVLNCDDQAATVVFGPELGDSFQVTIMTARQYVGTAATIIQRDGKPFHWPVSEAYIPGEGPY